MDRFSSDWVPGGRKGTHESYREGHERTFGEQDIFKNLADKPGGTNGKEKEASAEEEISETGQTEDGQES